MRNGIIAIVDLKLSYFRARSKRNTPALPPCVFHGSIGILLRVLLVLLVRLFIVAPFPGCSVGSRSSGKSDKRRGRVVGSGEIARVLRLMAAKKFVNVSCRVGRFQD